MASLGTVALSTLVQTYNPRTFPGITGGTFVTHAPLNQGTVALPAVPLAVTVTPGMPSTTRYPKEP